MKTADASFHYCYSGQAVVDEKSQSSSPVLSPAATDVDQLTPMIEAMDAQLYSPGSKTTPRCC